MAIKICPLEQAAAKHTVRSGQARLGYMHAVGPYFELLSKLKLPPRGPRGSRQNKRRKDKVAEALHREKMRRKVKGKK